MPQPRDEFTGRFVSDKDVERYEVTVWNVVDGDILEVNYEASQRDLDEIEERYEDEPGIEIQIELRPGFD